jgi:hypothetical protein
MWEDLKAVFLPFVIKGVSSSTETDLSVVMGLFSPIYEQTQQKKTVDDATIL